MNANTILLIVFVCIMVVVIIGVLLITVVVPWYQKHKQEQEKKRIVEGYVKSTVPHNRVEYGKQVLEAYGLHNSPPPISYVPIGNAVYPSSDSDLDSQIKLPISYVPTENAVHTHADSDSDSQGLP